MTSVVRAMCMIEHKVFIESNKANGSAHSTMNFVGKWLRMGITYIAYDLPESDIICSVRVVYVEVRAEQFQRVI